MPVGPHLRVVGHPDAVGRPPLPGAALGVVEVTIRGPEAERGHPAPAARAALHAQGLFGEARDAVIAAMDTATRTWDHEVIPAARVATALRRVTERLAPLGAHLARNGPDPDALPERDFSAGSRQCRACPFLDACMPAPTAGPVETVTDEEARTALRDYAELRNTIREFEDERRWVLERFRAWLARRSADEARVRTRAAAEAVSEPPRVG